MERYICIHGHFYQPPRENPALDAIEIQDSAYPYHDWNERITAECYAPNAAARILDGGSRIVKLVNNYTRMSFDFGPTLLSWLEKHHPEVYQAIIAADHQSRQRFSGHGSALAQPYNHAIIPLLNPRDRETQLRWGIRDFEQRFGRSPEGMWLPETAVDLETLDSMAQLGIRFTILAPWQAARVRRIGDTFCREVYGGQIDPSMAYVLRLPSGRTINLFFYDGPISGSVAFERVLNKGIDLVHRLMMGFSAARTWRQLVHIATDGETYGHHRRHGEMALAYALDYIESRGLAHLTNYGEYLERYPPSHEVEIIEHTSWSCAHGVERWRRDCGCHSGGFPGWSQGWRAPLRAALDWLNDTLALRYEQYAARLFLDPWAARDDYITVVLDRSPHNVAAFLARHGMPELEYHEHVAALKLLESQRHAMLMYTSCGWFFDDLSGSETVQVIRHAGHALRLAQEVFDDGIEAGFLDRLEQAKSNLGEYGDGRWIYERWVRPALVNLLKVGAHYAVSSLFDSYGEHTRLYCYSIDREDHQLFCAGRPQLALGRIDDLALLQILAEGVRVAHSTPLDLSLWKPQHIYDELRRTVYPTFREQATRADANAQLWLDRFGALGEQLGFRVGTA